MLSIGDRVMAGFGEDEDAGVVLAIRGEMVQVEWDMAGEITWQHASILSVEI